MARSDVLVSADWVESNLYDAGRGRHRGRRGHHVLRPQPHPRRDQARLAHGPAGPGPPRLRRQGRSSRRCCPAAASRTTTPSSSTAATTTGSRRTRTGTSSSTATATSSSSTAGARSGSSTGASSARSRSSGRRRSTPRATRTPRSAPSATRSWPRSACRTSSTSARPDEFSGRLLAPAHLPQEQSQRGGHIPTAINVPWSKAANEDGTFKSDDDLRELYAERGPRRRQGHDRLLPHRRALEPHLVRAPRAARPPAGQELRRLRGPSTARSSASRSRRRPEPGTRTRPGNREKAEAVTCAEHRCRAAPRPGGRGRHEGDRDPGSGRARRRAGPSAYVRLLDSGGEFTAEVVSSDSGDFRFFAAPGSWTVRALAPAASPASRGSRPDTGITTVHLELAAT